MYRQTPLRELIRRPSEAPQPGNRSTRQNPPSLFPGPCSIASLIHPPVDGRKDDQKWGQTRSKMGAKTIENGAKTINSELFYALYVRFQPDPLRSFAPMEQDVFRASDESLPFVGLEAGIFLLFVGLQRDSVSQRAELLCGPPIPAPCSLVRAPEPRPWSFTFEAQPHRPA